MQLARESWVHVQDSSSSSSSSSSSEEGTCQGDPLAMAAYAVAIMPLINTLEERCQETTQCWFADDDGAASSIASLRDYWNELSKEGPGYGCFPNAKKTVLLVKPEHRDDADRLFSNTGINIRSTGCRYLGGSLGEEFMKEMVQKWCQQICTLAEIAHTQPHAAHAVFTRSVTANSDTTSAQRRAVRRFSMPLTRLSTPPSCLLLRGESLSRISQREQYLPFLPDLVGLQYPVLHRRRSVKTRLLGT